MGIWVELKSQKSIDDLVKWNQHLSELSPLMPPVYPEFMRFEILGSTHYNAALRLGKDGCHSPAGDLAALKNKDASFKAACEKGHHWIVLPETLADSLKVDVANQNVAAYISIWELRYRCSFSWAVCMWST